jgi:hypothetical protein
MNVFRVVNVVSLLVIVALITAVLALRARSDAEWQALVTGVGGEDVITFRLQRDAADAPSWTPGHLTDLGALTGVSDVFWRGGYAYIQGPASAYVLPLTVASPGFLSARQVTFVAGRDLSEEDAGRPRVVLNQQHAREIFPELSLGDILGQEVRVDNERLEIVGIAADHDEVDAAFRAARTPPLSYPGRYDIQTVYLRLNGEADAAAVVEQANAYLAATEALAMLEAVPYREFVRPGVIDERLDYVREIAALFGWLVAFAILLGVINLVNQALLSAAARRQRWALHRVLGATRGRLVARELLVGSGAEWAAVAGGVLLGGWLGAQLGGLFNLRVGLSGVLVGGLSLLLGSVPLVAGVLTLHPYGALRQSRGLARHPLLALLGGLGLLGGLALVVVAGGFRDLGQRAIGAEVEAIGADLVALVPDRRSILPVAHPTEEDVAALRAAFPEVPVTRFERHLASVRGGDAGGEAAPHPPYEAEVVVADDAFVAVSGTPLEAGRWEGGGVVLGSAVAAALFPEGDALGRQVTLEGQWSGSERTFVVEAVAAPPPTERLEALALRPDAVLLPRTLASPFALSAEASGAHRSPLRRRRRLLVPRTPRGADAPVRVGRAADLCASSGRDCDADDRARRGEGVRAGARARFRGDAGGCVSPRARGCCAPDAVGRPVGDRRGASRPLGVGPATRVPLCRAERLARCRARRDVGDRLDRRGRGRALERGAFPVSGATR